MRRWPLLVLLLLATTALAGCTGFFFYPSPAYVLTPSQLELKYQDVHFQTADGLTLHGWFLPARGSARATILFLHGNAENISTHIASVYWLPARGFNVFLFDYRGYGSSQGEPSFAGLQTDTEAALRYLIGRPDIDPDRLVVFGQSLGASVAIYAVAHTLYRAHIRALVSESAFASYRGIVREKLGGFWLTWLLQWPVSWTISNAYSPVAAIPLVSPIPVLIVHGDADPIVPVADAYRLYRAAREPKTLWIVPGGGHIAAFRRPEYRDRLVRYLDRVLAAPP